MLHVNLTAIYVLHHDHGRAFMFISSESHTLLFFSCFMLTLLALPYVYSLITVSAASHLSITILVPENDVTACLCPYSTHHTVYSQL